MQDTQPWVSSSHQKKPSGYKTCNIKSRNSFVFNTIILHFIALLTPSSAPSLLDPVPEQSYVTMYLSCKARKSQQAPKVASVAQVALPHASLSPFLLGTTCYTQLQETDQDGLGTIYNTLSEIML